MDSVEMMFCKNLSFLFSYSPLYNNMFCSEYRLLAQLMFIRAFYSRLSLQAYCKACYDGIILVEKKFQTATSA